MCSSQPDHGDIVSMREYGHKSVLLGEVLEFLVPREGQGGLYLDGTLGLGGHAGAVLRKAGPEARLLGLDRDEEALGLAGERLAGFGAAAVLRKSAFADFAEALDGLGWEFIDGALVDLGLSSLQLDKAERGFSFQNDGPLDMRMDPDGGAETAAALVNRLPVSRLKEIIEVYGEEPQAGRIARAIDGARSVKPLERTLELAEVAAGAYPPKWRATARNHPATRTFQALRLAVNGELDQLESFLRGIVGRLKPGGRVAVISFHSLEDRIVKRFFRTESTGCLCPPQVVNCACGHLPSLRLVTRKAVRPGEGETGGNVRARSAKLRVAERTANAYGGGITAAGHGAAAENGAPDRLRGPGRVKRGGRKR